MKKKSAFLLLTSVALLAACGSNNGNGGDVVSKPDESSDIIPTLEDDILDFADGEARVEVGKRYEPDHTYFKSTSGNEYKLNVNLFITAVDSNGKDVRITNGSFLVQDMAGYIVYYRCYQGKAFKERKVRVAVYDSTSPNIEIHGWRKEREVGTFPLPEVVVLDNSGQAIRPTYDITESDGRESDAVTIIGDNVQITRPGKYTYTAYATDAMGNRAKKSQDIVITPSMGTYVWDDFSNENHLEVFRASDHYTSQTVTKWHQTFAGASGVAEVMPNYQERNFRSSFLQIGLNKTVDEMLACRWDSFTVRMYVDTKNGESSVFVGNGDFTLGSMKTNEWVDYKIARKDYLVPSNYRMFPNMGKNDTKDERYEAFAKGITGDTPNLGLSINTVTPNTDLSIYIDSITWESAGADTEAPTVTLDGATSKILANSTFTLPGITITDNVDPLDAIKSKVNFYAVTASGDKEIAIVDNKVQIGNVGTYKLSVYVEDSSGNKATREFFFNAVNSIDPHVIASYDTEQEIGGMVGSLSWLGEWKGAEGVMKNVVPNAGDGLAGTLNLQFPRSVMENAVRDKFDYIRFRVYVEAPTSSESIGMYSFWQNYGAIKLNEWNEFDVTLAKLADNSALNPHGSTPTEPWTRDQVYEKFLHTYVYNAGPFMSTNDPELVRSAADVTYYFDEITWGKTYDGDFIQSLPGMEQSYDSSEVSSIPVPDTAMVSDGLISTEKKLDSAVIERREGSKWVALQPNEDGEVDISVEGLYRVVAKLAGCADYIFTFSVETLGNTIWSFSNDQSISGIGGQTTWMEEFQGASGVMKDVVPDAGDGLAGTLNFQFPRAIMENAVKEKFDYIHFRVYVEAPTTSESIGMYSFWQNYGALKLNEWNDFNVTLDKLADNSVLNPHGSTPTEPWTRDQVYEKFLHTYVYNAGPFMSTNDEQLVKNHSDVTYYFDEISWGKTYDGDFIKEIPGLKTSYDGTVTKTLPVPQTALVSDGLISRTQKLDSAVIERKDGETWTALTPDSNNEVDISKEGAYRVVAKLEGYKDYVFEFVVENLSNVIYDFASDETYGENPPYGLGYPASSAKVQFDYHNGGSNWMASFTGQDGVTEYGVQKAARAQSVLRFDIGHTPFEFDYIKVRVYFETSSAEKMRIYSGYSPICEGTNALPANAWTDLVIRRESLATAGATMYKDGLTGGSGVENFYSDCFGIPGYNNQNCFNFQMYNGDTAALLQDVTVYISRISYGVDA